MSLMLRLQLLALGASIASMVFVNVYVGAQVPAPRLLACNAIMVAFNLWWGGSIAWLRWRGVADDTPDGWRAHTIGIFWLGNLMTVSTFWLALPYADEAMRLTAAMMCLGPMTVEAIGTVRTPPYERRGVFADWAPPIIPAGLTAWFLPSDDRFGLAVSLFLPAFCAVMLLLREVVQNVLNDAYAAQLEAEAGRDARARFLASASHDLGQPLQAARLFFDQTLRARSGADRQAAVGRVNWAFDAMEQHLRQMLDYLRLEARHVAPEIQVAPLGLSIARVTELNEPAARLAGIDVLAAPTRLAARGDPALIDRVLGNFLVNAIRHAGARRVLIGARRRGPRVRLWVLDDGRGVPPAERAGLFEEYVQGAWTAGEVRGGFGLGLASARRMAELMDGDVGHDPAWRHGSAFWLELPLAPDVAS